MFLQNWWFIKIVMSIISQWLFEQTNTRDNIFALNSFNVLDEADHPSEFICCLKCLFNLLNVKSFCSLGKSSERTGFVANHLTLLFSGCDTLIYIYIYIYISVCGWLYIYIYIYIYVCMVVWKVLSHTQKELTILVVAIHYSFLNP